MSRETLLEKLKDLKKQRGAICRIETSVGMPKNSLSRYVNGHAEMPMKWVEPIETHLAKEDNVVMIELPKDYMEITKVAVLKSDGTIEPIESIENFPANSTHFLLSLRALEELKTTYTQAGEIGLIPTILKTGVPEYKSNLTMKHIEDHIEETGKEHTRAKISELETEFKGLGDGILAKQRKRFIEGRISELKKQLK